MAKSRKDCKGRALNKGECQRKSDGRYIYQYMDPGGKRRVIYATDLTQLREKETRLVKDQLDGLQGYCEGKATLNYVYDRYIATKYDLKANTKAHYNYMYDHCVRETLGQRLITDIKYSDVKFFYYSLLNEGGLKINSLDNVHTVLHPTFEMAVRDGVIRNNPSDRVMSEIKKSSGKNKGIRHALTLEQQRAFLGYIEKSNIYRHWLPLFTVLFGTGCRIGEIIGLRWEDLDYDKCSISINHTIGYVSIDGKKRDYHVSLPKTEAGIRTIPMMDAVKQAFLDEYAVQEKNGFNTQVVDGMSGFVFRNKNGNLFNHIVINDAIQRIYEAYNAEEIINAQRTGRTPVLIPRFSCHHIRHTFCTRFCENETNLKVIQSIMGHASIETTMNIYAEATELKKQEAVKTLENNGDIF